MVRKLGTGRGSCQWCRASEDSSTRVYGCAVWLGCSGRPRLYSVPDQHHAIWVIQQKPLDFPSYVYNVSRPPEGATNMQEITNRRSELLEKHVKDRVVRQ
jgi:hypothetical protein